MKKYLILGFVALLLSACGNYKPVQERTLSDNRMNCSQLKSEIKKMESFRTEVSNHQGNVSSKVALGLLFWPGLFVDGANSSEAISSIDKRLSFLYSLLDKKKCK